MVKPSLKQNLQPPLKQSPRWLRWPIFKTSAAEMQAEMQAETQAKPFGAALPTPERDPAKPSLPPDLPAQPGFKLGSKQWHWPLVWVSALAVLGGMGTAALVWLVSLPPQIDCKQPGQLSLDMERLYCAQEAAQSGEIAKLIAGIDLLKQWQPEHPLYGEAQRLITEWSDQVLTISTNRVVRGDLKGAEAAISHIPTSTPIHQDAQAALSRWRKYSQRATKLNEKAQAALKQKDWSAVSDYIVLLSAFERDYWELENGAEALARQLGVEKQAWQAFARAQRLAENPQQLGAAIALAQQMSGQTYAAAVAKASLKQWSQKLVERGNQQWLKGDRLGAIATLRLAPKTVNQPEIDEMYRFGHAYALANPALSSRWAPTVENLVNLAEAITAMAQVKPDSPFHNQAQLFKTSWQAQLQDLIQLKYASAAADFEHPAMLNLAVKQAQQIDPDAPRRLQAQTLIAHWQRETERIEDQPMVDRALHLAKGGSIDSFKAAIAAASQVPLGRALRQQSQTLIASWRSQIQTLEDRPQLEQATDLAQQGNLEQAIQMASQIGAGRALYRDAQTAIGDWRNQQRVNSQIAQDQPILDQALAQAAAGQLSSAIATASRIGSGRALSSRAQASIRQWEIQLNPPQPSPDGGFLAEPADNPLETLFPDNQWPNQDSQPENRPENPDNSPAASPDPSVSPSSPPRPWLPSEIETVPPPGTYQPYTPPQDSRLPAPSPERSEAPDPEPSQSADPLPPLDPLPPRP